MTTRGSSSDTTGTPAAAEDEGAGEGGWVCIGHESSYGSRTKISVHKRHITILRTGTGAHAVDTVCYHAGGPLTDGAVRRVAGRLCVQCPWHRYLVDIESGEGLYMDLDRRYRSKGVRQRVHEIVVRDEHFWVRLREGGSVASDGYAYGRGGEKVDLPSFPPAE